MSEENLNAEEQAEQAIPPEQSVDSPVQGAAFEAPTGQPISALSPQTPEQISEAAAKAAIDASGTVHLSAIFRNKVNETHAKVANLVAKIMTEAARAENWTHDEVVAIWNRIEAELNSAA